MGFQNSEYFSNLVIFSNFVFKCQEMKSNLQNDPIVCFLFMYNRKGNTIISIL